MAVIDGSDIVFSSGRRAYCFNGNFSVEELDDGTFRVRYGYDDSLAWPDNDYLDPEERLTSDDIREVADMMIARWQRLRAAL
jgi:hypothetical protein